MTKSKRRRPELRRKEAEASLSAYTALKDPSKSSGDAQASQMKVEVETSRPVKKRVVAGRPQAQIPQVQQHLQTKNSQSQNLLRTQNIPKTQSSSGPPDACSAYSVQPTFVDENKQDFLHKNYKEPQKSASHVRGDRNIDRDGFKPRDNLQDQRPPSLLHKSTSNSSDSEVNVLYQGFVQELSTFTPTKKNVIGETAEEWTVRLHSTDRLALLGQYEIWVRMGAVAVMGAVIHAGSTVHRVHAPSTHSLPVIRACQSPFMPDDQTAEITILSISRTGIRQLKEISPAFSCIWNHRPLPIEQSSPNIDLSQRSYIFLKSSAEDVHRRPLYALEYPICWQREISRYRNPLSKCPPPTVMVCGLKGTGKSTFCRILANTMLSNRVNSNTVSYGFARRDYLGAKGIAFLDLDPGQPEYSPPGEVTLMYMRRFNLGVPYAHPIIGISEPNSLIRAHHIGAVSANDDPRHYQRCVLDLFRHYQHLLSKDPSCPLVINCSGWVTASGLEVLVGLIEKMAPSNIVYTREKRSEVAAILSEAAAKVGADFQPLMSHQPPTLTRTASDLRMMQALSYFHIDEPEGINLGWDRAPLNEVAPLTVRYSGASQDIFAIMILGQEQDPELYRYIFEGSVVGVVVLEDDTAIIGVKNDGLLGSVGAVSRKDDSATQADGQLGSVGAISRKDDSATQADDQLNGVGACLEDVIGRYKDHPRGHGQSDKFKVFRTSKHDSMSDEDSDVGDMQGSDESDFRPLPRQKSRKTPVSGNSDSQPNQTSSKVINHPLVSRTPEGLPYLYTGTQTGFQSALDPSKSYSIGQALIHGIDPDFQTIHLYTPIPTSTLQSLARQDSKIVLVRGGLDMPTWAFLEEYHAMATRRRQSESSRDGKGCKLLGSEMKEWAQRTPWAALKDERGERSSARVRHSRRNLRTG